MTIYFSKNESTFYDDMIHDHAIIPIEAIEISRDMHIKLLKALNTGCVIKDDLTYSPPKPSEHHYWNGYDWIEDIEAKNEAKRLFKIDILNAEFNQLKQDLIFLTVMGEDTAEIQLKIKEIEFELQVLQ